MGDSKVEWASMSGRLCRALGLLSTHWAMGIQGHSQCQSQVPSLVVWREGQPTRSKGRGQMTEVYLPDDKEVGE
jgi:hypothetical protein